MVTPAPSGYSARVSFVLLAGSEQFSPAQIGGGRIIFDRDVLLPGTCGELIAEIDEHQQRWQLTWGASDQPRRRVDVEFRELADAAGESQAKQRQRAGR